MKNLNNLLRPESVKSSDFYKIFDANHKKLTEQAQAAKKSATENQIAATSFLDIGVGI